jgi:uncharacterized protein YndB with AHSA1/START domain
MMNTTNPTTITAQPGVPFVDIVREFDAPVSAVYRAYTESALAEQWLGPRGYEMETVEWNIATGGRYRYIHRDPAGEEYAFNGVVHTARKDEVIIQTFEFEGAPGQVSIESATFEDLGGGRSRVSGHSVFPTVEPRDMMVEQGMERGVVEGHVRLDELLATL